MKNGTEDDQKGWHLAHCLFMGLSLLSYFFGFVIVEEKEKARDTTIIGKAGQNTPNLRNNRKLQQPQQGLQDDQGQQQQAQLHNLDRLHKQRSCSGRLDRQQQQQRQIVDSEPLLLSFSLVQDHHHHRHLLAIRWLVVVSFGLGLP